MCYWHYRGRKLLHRFIFISIISILPCLAWALPNHVDKMKSQLYSIDRQIADVEKTVSQEQFQYEQAEKELRQTDLTLSQITKALHDSNQQLQLQTTKLILLKQQQNVYEQSLIQQQTELAAQIRTMYLIGKQDYFKLLLNQQDPSAISRNMTYFQYLNESRLDLIGNLNHTLEQVQKNQQAIVNETQAIAALQNDQKKQQEQLAEVRQSRQKVLSHLHLTLDTDKQQLNLLSSNRNNLQNLIRQLQTDTAQSSPTTMPVPFARLRGSLPWPTQGAILSHYDTPISGSELTSTGVELQAPEGQGVYAVYPGRVLFSSWLKGFGLLLIVEHGDGYMTLYGHNQSLFKKTGEEVNAGELIAHVGDSGGAARTGLYFEIRHNGQPINPELWCK